MFFINHTYTYIHTYTHLPPPPPPPPPHTPVCDKTRILCVCELARLLSVFLLGVRTCLRVCSHFAFQTVNVSIKWYASTTGKVTVFIQVNGKLPLRYSCTLIVTDYGSTNRDFSLLVDIGFESLLPSTFLVTRRVRAKFILSPDFSI